MRWWESPATWLWTGILLAVTLIGVVLAKGGWVDELNLASSLASGAVVAVAVTYWEYSHRRRDERLRTERLKLIQQTLIHYVGTELSTVALAVEIDEDGSQLFGDVNEALAAFQTHAAIERVRTEVARRAMGGYVGPELVRRVAQAMLRFFHRLESHADAMLAFFLDAGDQRKVDAMLALSGRRTGHDELVEEAASEALPPPSVHAALIEIARAPALQKGYLSFVSEVLTDYAELLRAIEGVPSGIAGRR